MSFLIPTDRFGTSKKKPKLDVEVKARRKRDNEKIRMPKGTTIKDVKKVQKENNYRASVKLKEVARLIIDNNVNIDNQYEVNRLVSLLIQNNVFGNKIEAKTFVIAYKDLIPLYLK